MSACDRCREVGLYDCTESGACRCATPDAQAKRESRTGQTGPWHSELEPVFDAYVYRRNPPRYGISGFEFDLTSVTSVLKQRYSELDWRGTYAQESVLSGLQRFDWRLHRLRRTPLRDRDVLAKLAGCKPYNWLREYERTPFLALIKKGAAV